MPICRLLLAGEAPDVDDVGGLEGPDQGLDPGHDGKEADPAHEVHRIGARVLAGNRDPARKPQDKESSSPARRADNY